MLETGQKGHVYYTLAKILSTLKETLRLAYLIVLPVCRYVLVVPTEVRRGFWRAQDLCKGYSSDPKS